MPELATSGVALLRCAPLAFGFVWLSLALGRRFLRVLGAGTAGASLAERAIVAFGLGLAVLEFVPFVLGAAGVLGVRSLLVALAVVSAAASVDLAAVARRAGDAKECLRSALREEPWLFLALT